MKSMDALVALTGLALGWSLSAAAAPQDAYSLDVLRQPTNTFESPWIAFHASEIGDVTGDGRAEHIKISSSYQTLSVSATSWRDGDATDWFPLYEGFPISIRTADFAGTDLGDVNGDGVQDLIVSGARSFDVLTTGGTRTWSLRTLPAHAELIAGKPGARLLDVDGDGALDLVGHFHAAAGSAPADRRSRLVVFSGDGHGGFAETASTVTGAELAGDTLTAHSIAVGDFNGDGRPDVALSLEEFDAASQSRSYPLRIFLNDGAGALAPGYELQGEAGTVYDFLAAGDLDGDGRDDLAATDTFTDAARSRVHVFRQDAQGVLGDERQYPAMPNGGLHMADLDGDGRLDLLVAFPRYYVYYLQREDGTLLQSPYRDSRAEYSAGPPTPSGIAVGDLGGDGCPDAVVTSSQKTWIMQARGCPPRTLSDLDNDGHSDLLWRDDAREHLAAWRMRGGERIDGFGHAVPPQWRVLATGDFDGDRKLDLIWTDDRHMELWRGDGAGGYTELPMRDYPEGWRVVAAGDINGDGRADLLWRNQDNTAANAWALDGAQIVGGASYATSPDWWVVGSGDLDGDARTDIVWTDGARMQLWRATTQLAFVGEAMPDFPQGWQLEAIGDTDGDRRGDLFWRQPEFGHVAVWSMQGGNLLGTVGYSPGRDWRVVQAGDFSGDARMDLIWTDGRSMQLWQAAGDGFVGVPMQDYPQGWSTIRR